MAAESENMKKLYYHIRKGSPTLKVYWQICNFESPHKIVGPIKINNTKNWHKPFHQFFLRSGNITFLYSIMDRAINV